MRQITVEIDEHGCKGCELCMKACPRDVLAKGTHVNAMGYQVAAVVDPSRCTGCKACYLVCPEVAFTIWQSA